MVVFCGLGSMMCQLMIGWEFSLSTLIIKLREMLMLLSLVKNDLLLGLTNKKLVWIDGITENITEMIFGTQKNSSASSTPDKTIQC